MKYKTIVIDPPWSLGILSPNYRWRTGHLPKLTYNTMSIDEIKSFPINDFADEKCDIFIWCTHTTIQYVFDILKIWGFKYHCIITWDKIRSMVLFGFHRSTEFCVYAYKNKMGVIKNGKSIPTLIKSPRENHSTKPSVFYEIIRDKTQEPRIDIFARKRHEGFDYYGDQVELTLQKTLTQESQS